MTLKKLVFLGVLGLADCTPGREPRSVAASYQLDGIDANLLFLLIIILYVNLSFIVLATYSLHI